MVLQSMKTNFTIVQNITETSQPSNSNSFNYSDWKIIQEPEFNPKGYLGFTFEMWKCLVILAVLSVGLRAISMIFLKLLINRF